MPKNTDFSLAKDENDAPVLHIQDAKLTDSKKAPAAPDEEQPRYSLLTASAIRLLNSGGQMMVTKGTYRLMVDPKVGQTILAGVKGSPGLYRGFSRAGGKIVQQAKFKPVQAAKFTMLAMAAFEVATFVTSTVHLKEIGRQLKQVNVALGQIHDLIDDQRLGRLLGAVTYLNEILVLLEAAPLDSASKQRYDDQLETIYRECLVELRTADQQLRRRQQELNKAEKLTVGGFLFFKKIKEKDDIETLVADFSASLEIALLAQEVAAMCCAVASQLGRLPAQNRHRLKVLEQEVDGLKANWNLYANVLKTKFEEVEERREVHEKLRKLAQLVQQHRERPKKLLLAVSTMQEQLKYQDQLEFLVRVENGEVLETRRVLPGQ